MSIILFTQLNVLNYLQLPLRNMKDVLKGHWLLMSIITQMFVESFFEQSKEMWDIPNEQYSRSSWLFFITLYFALYYLLLKFEDVSGMRHVKFIASICVRRHMHLQIRHHVVLTTANCFVSLCRVFYVRLGMENVYNVNIKLQKRSIKD